MVSTIKNILRPVKSAVLWSIYTMRMDKFIDASASFTSNEANRHLAIIVQPLYMISWPFFMIALGLLLQKKGKAITYIVDNTNFEKNILIYKLKMSVINHCMQKLFLRGFQVVRLSDEQMSDDHDYTSPEKLMALAHTQAIWLTRGEMAKIDRDREYMRFLQQLTFASGRIQSMLKSLNLERIIIACGIVGTSGIYFNCGKYLHIPVSTIDGGEGVNLMSNSGPAAQLTDIPLAFKLFPDAEKAYAYDQANRLIRKRMDGNDPFAYQIKKFADEDHESGNILVLLNSVWDQAALGLHTVYPSMNEWIFETVKWVLENTKETILVRQHPAERNKKVSTRDDYTELLKPFLQHERFNFISANSDINTYGLIQKCKVVIAYSTTTALEATMIGKPVITVSNCYYSDLGFVYKPRQLEEYYHFILQSILGQLFLSASQKNDAALCYYLSQGCNWVFTDFGATVKDFKQWVTMDPASIFELPEVQDMLDSLINGTPIALIRHKKMFNQSKKAHPIADDERKLLIENSL